MTRTRFETSVGKFIEPPIRDIGPQDCDGTKPVRVAAQRIVSDGVVVSRSDRVDDDTARDAELAPDGKGVFDRKWLCGSEAALISRRKAIEGAVDVKMTIAAAFRQSVIHTQIPDLS